MAEAHRAVAFSFSITHDGVSVSFDQELIRVIWHTWVHDYKRRFGRFKNNFKTGIYPATYTTLLITIALVWGLKTFSVGFVSKPINWARNKTFGDTYVGTGVVTVLFATLVWFALVQMCRVLLKMLLSYRGWMFEKRGKMSITTRCWLFMMHNISKLDPMLHSYQGALPRLPVPDLNVTLEKHLKSVRPILNDEQYNEMVQLSEDFKKDGKRFQWYLWLKSLFSVNYVTDWWEQYVYLRSREPIMINSNYYGLDTIFNHPTKNQAARAGNVVRAAMLFRRSLDRQELKPIMHSGVPLCSAQYERLFNTCRIPGEESDQLKHWTTSRHLAVFCNGCWWKFPVHTAQRLLTAAEMQTNFQKILDDQSEPSPGERHLAALTAGKRLPWARARKDFFSSGVNKNSLHVIESSAFTLILDKEEYNYDPDDYTKLDDWALAMLHGKGYDRWYDKTFNLIVSANGRTGMNAEHSWGDAPSIAHLMEELNYRETNKDGNERADAPIIAHLFESALLTEHLEMKYTEEGDCAPTDIDEAEAFCPEPERLKWDINEECQAVIEQSLGLARDLLSGVELKLLVFREYGKGFMKKANISPDAYIQFALHATYFKMHQSFPLTYEACMTRLYREGRTETVRAITSESTDFVRAFVNPETEASEKLTLMRRAGEAHVRMYRNAMAGQGIDRHLFALYVVSRYLEVDSPFLEKVLKEPWLLSTSQTPHQQTKLIDLNKPCNARFVSAGGGFGPVSEKGYGVSYIIGGEDMLSFHISAKNACKETSAERFRETLIQTLRDMKDMIQTEKQSSPAKTNGAA